MAHDSIHWMQTFLSSTISRAQADSWKPLADVYRTPSGWLIKYDLAGVKTEDVSLTVSGPRLILRGTRRDCCLEEGCCHYRMEISYSRFERTIELPENIEPACMFTEFRQGMLLVRLEKETRS